MCGFRLQAEGCVGIPWIHDGRITSAAEKPLVVPEPVAREHPAGIEPVFLGDELAEPRVARQRLGGGRPAVIGQVVAAAELDRAIDETAEVPAAAFDAIGRMVDVQVEDDTGPALTRPGEHRLIVLFDDADGAVDDVGAVLARVGADRSHELGERGARHVELGDHLAALDRRSELAIEVVVVAVRIVGELMGVASSTTGRRSPCSSARTRRTPATCTCARAAAAAAIRAARAIAARRGSARRSPPAGSRRTRRPAGTRAMPDRWRTDSRRTR